MSRIHCGKRMEAAMAAMLKWANEHPEFDVDVHPECREDWGPTYAIVEVTFEGVGQYLDRERGRADFMRVFQDVLGPRFKQLTKGEARAKDLLVDGQLYFIDHWRELEIYRYRADGKYGMKGENGRFVF